MLPFFQRTGKVAGIVEFVLSGHRLKVSSSAKCPSLASLRCTICATFLTQSIGRNLVRVDDLGLTTLRFHFSRHVPTWDRGSCLPMQITVPKEGVTVAFCPSGVRAPQRGSAMGRDGCPGAVSFHHCSASAAQRRVSAQLFCQAGHSHLWSASKSQMRRVCGPEPYRRAPCLCRRSHTQRRHTSSCASWLCSAAWSLTSKPWTGKHPWMNMRILPVASC